MKKRISGILIGFGLMLALMPVLGMIMPVHAFDESPYKLWVCGVAVTDENREDVLSDGVVSFTPAKDGKPATLTLKGNVTADPERHYYGAAIRCDDGEHDLIIDAAEPSVVKGPVFDEPVSMNGYGIYSEAPLTVSGKLEVDGGNAEYGDGIYGHELVVDYGAEVKASGRDAAVSIIGGKVEVNGKLTADSEYIGLYIDNESGGLITVNDGAELAAVGMEAAGIGCRDDRVINIIIEKGAKVSAVGKDAVDIKGTVKNAVTGLGWSDAERTGTPEVIAASESGHDIDGKYKYVEFRAHTHDDITFEPWIDGDSLPSRPGSYYLMQDVTISSAWKIKNQTVNLCLNGYKITLKDAVSKVIELSHDSHEPATKLCLFDEEGNEGVITGGKTSGVVVYADCEFHMHGGTISGNTAGDQSAIGGGGVNVEGGYFNMSGGIITGNTADKIGGGVSVYPRGTFNMSGGIITDNIAGKYGGGAALWGGGSGLHLSGSPTITGNHVGTASADNNVYLSGAHVSVVDVLDNKASIGISMDKPGVFTQSGAFKAKDYIDNFTSDSAGYTVEAADDELKLVHRHSFTYTASDGIITATCSVADCPLPAVDGKHVATLTIAASDGVYDGTTSYGATVTDENNIRGDAEIEYYEATADDQRGDPVTGTPVNAGKYWAEITLGPGADSETATAHVVYTIAKATPEITTNPTATGIIYGQALSDSTLSDGVASVDGSFAWSAPSTKPEAAGSTSYGVTFTPDDSDNYDTATCDVSLTVDQKEIGLEWTNTELTYNGQEQAPTAAATGLVTGDEGKVDVTVSGGQTGAGTYTATASGLTGEKAGSYKLPAEKTTTFTISPKSIDNASVTFDKYELTYNGSEQNVSVTGVSLDGVDLTAGTDYDVSGTAGTDKGDYKVTVTGKGNFKDTATADWKIVEKADPTPVGSVHKAGAGTYVVKSAKTVWLKKPVKNKTTFTVPATVKIKGKTFKVTGISAKAFKGKKVKTLTVKTKKLTKKSVKGSLKSSKIKTIKVKVGKKKLNKKYVKKYKKIFTKKNAGRKVKIIS